MYDTKQAHVSVPRMKLWRRRLKTAGVRASAVTSRAVCVARAYEDAGLNGHSTCPSDASAMPVLVTRTKTEKVAVTFKANGMLAPPPKSSLARGQGPAAQPTATSATKTIEIVETDNPMAALMDLFVAAPESQPEPATLASQPPAGDSATAATGQIGLVDLLGAAQSASPAPTSAPLPAFDVLQPTVHAAAQPRTMAEMQAVRAATAASSLNPFAQSPTQQNANVPTHRSLFPDPFNKT